MVGTGLRCSLVIFLNFHLEAADKTQALLDTQRRHVEELQSHLDKQRQDTEIALDSERQTVALLVNEKSHLTAELEKCQDFESSMFRPHLVTGINTH